MCEREKEREMNMGDALLWGWTVNGMRYHVTGLVSVGAAISDVVGSRVMTYL